MTYVLDIVVLVIFVAAVFLGFKRGLLKSVIGVVGFLAALMVAFMLSETLTPWAYDTFVKTPTETAIQTAVGDTASNASASLEQNLQKAEEELPALVKGMMEKSKVSLTDLSQKMEGGVENTATAIAETVTEQVVKPVMLLLIRCILFFALFVLARIAVTLLEKILGGIIKHTPLKSTDKLLGLLLGAVKGLLWVLLAVTVMQFIAGFTTETALISEKSIEDSAVVSKIAELNPIYSDNNVIMEQFNALFE